MLTFQRLDFEGIFTAMSGLPVTIRLLDPPLHEFLPQPDAVTACARSVRDQVHRGLAHCKPDRGEGWRSTE